MKHYAILLDSGATLPLGPLTRPRALRVLARWQKRREAGLREAWAHGLEPDYVRVIPRRPVALVAVKVKK